MFWIYVCTRGVLVWICLTVFFFCATAFSIKAVCSGVRGTGGAYLASFLAWATATPKKRARPKVQNLRKCIYRLLVKTCSLHSSMLERSLCLIQKHRRPSRALFSAVD